MRCLLLVGMSMFELIFRTFHQEQILRNPLLSCESPHLYSPNILINKFGEPM